MSTDPAPTNDERLRDGCPSDDELASFIEGTVPADRHAVLIAHVEACRRCVAVVGTVSGCSDRPAPPPVPAALLLRASALVPARRPVLRRVLVPAFAAAACVLLAAALWLPGRRSSTADRPLIPSSVTSRPDDVRSSGAGAVPVIVQPRAGTLPAGPATFVWTAVPGAAFYEVRVTTGDGDSLWSTTTDATRASWDGRGRGPGRRYFAWVSAATADGRRAASAIVALEEGAER